MYQPHMAVTGLLNGNQIFFGRQLDVWIVVVNQKILVAIFQV